MPNNNGNHRNVSNPNQSRSPKSKARRRRGVARSLRESARLHPHSQSYVRQSPQSTSYSHVRSRSPSPTSPAQESKLALSRAHLANSCVLRKNSILVSGLPSLAFKSLPSVQEYFARFGKICQCVENPKGVVIDNEEIDLKMGDRSTSNAIHSSSVFIAFMSEKSASLAVRDTNGKDIRSLFPSFVQPLSLKALRKQSLSNAKIHSRLVRTGYCKEFLNGKHCQDLNCVSLHELAKEYSSPKAVPGSAASTPGGKSLSCRDGNRYNHAPKNVRRAAPTAERRCWSTPRSFLAATMSGGGLNSDTRDDSSDGAKLFVTPESSLTGSSGSYQCSSSAASSTFDDDDVQYMEVEVDLGKRVEGLNLPAKQLFKQQACNNADFRVISAPDQTQRIRDSTMRVYASPWDFQSPMQLQKDNFESVRKSTPSCQPQGPIRKSDNSFGRTSPQVNAPSNYFLKPGNITGAQGSIALQQRPIRHPLYWQRYERPLQQPPTLHPYFPHHQQAPHHFPQHGMSIQSCVTNGYAHGFFQQPNMFYPVPPPCFLSHHNNHSA